MHTFTYLTDPLYRDLYWPAVLTGLALAGLCSMLSVLVVLKRLAFIGQGVSHAAFGGVGVAAMLGLVGTGTAAAAGGQFGIVLAFCVGAALLIGWLSERGGTEADTAIGIVLVGSMGLGAILLHHARSTQSWESFLFGAIINVGWIDAAIAGGVAVVVLGVLVALRRPLVFWAFDRAVARSLGVNDRAMNLLVMVLLAVTTVTAMKLAGVVLATALLVLPGAIALRLSGRTGAVLGWAGIAAFAGVVGGLVLSFELDWPTGPAIVCVLAGLFGVVKGWEGVRGAMGMLRGGRAG